MNETIKSERLKSLEKEEGEVYFSKYGEKGQNPIFRWWSGTFVSAQTLMAL